ncbi:MAG: hypothetical protein V4701_06580 [Pseudomonadota bacterium]
MKLPLLAIPAVLILSACTSAGGTSVTTALPSALSQTARVSSVVLNGAPAQGVSENFAQTFQSGVQAKLDECATGTTPLTLDVTLTMFDKANPAMTWLIADANRISGTARLRDASGAVVGEYQISRQFAASGLIGIAMMANAESQMSDAFGSEVCKQAFPDR